MLLERLSAGAGSLADQPERVLELALPAHPASASGARRALAEYCTSHHVPAEMRESGELLISELVTNAVLHASTPFLVWAEYDGGELTVAVVDGSPTFPQLFQFDDGQRQGGRGMAIVDEVGGHWGIIKTALGKIVWATVSGPAVPVQRT